MNYPRFRFIPLVLLILLPSIALAATFSIPSTDKSIEYLGAVFGRMGSLPIAPSGNVLFGQIMKLFNQIVLALATLIVIYTIVISTIHTAHEGEVMGKKWSSIFIPARIGAGLWLLVPSSSGYSYIQIVIMWFIMQGIGVANGLWEQVLSAYDRGEGIYETIDGSDFSAILDVVNPQGDANTLRGVLQSEICLNMINNNPINLEAINQGTPLTAFKSLDGSYIMWGIQSTEQAVCGSAALPSKTTVDQAFSTLTGRSSSSNQQFESFRAQVGDMILNGLNQDLSGPAQEAVSKSPENWMDFANLMTAKSNLNTQKQEILRKLATAGSYLQTSLARNALEDGWIFAGSYYSKLIAGNPSATISNINIMLTPPNFNLIGGGDFGAELSQKIDDLTTDYLKRASKDRNVNESSATREREEVSNLDSPMKEIVEAFYAPTWGLAKSLMKNLSSSTEDPMLSIAKMGGWMVSVSEIILFMLIAIVVIALAAAAIGMGAQPAGHVVNTVLSVALPVFMLFLAFFYVSGMTLALYIPLIPFLVFTFAAIAWMILVIEAIVAAPLVALILVVPSEDELGKAGHSLVILLGLILRPALMILGFIVAIKILLITVKMLNFGFASVVFEHLPPFSIFYPIGVVVLYTGILTYMVHEAFSLIYVIPDKVLRWMGGTPETEDIMGKVKKAEGDVEKGAASGKAAMGTGMGSLQTGAAKIANMKSAK